MENFKKFLGWCQKHWNERIFKMSTVLAIVFCLFHHFYSDLLYQLFKNIINNQSFIDELSGAVIAVLVGFKKF